MPTLSGMQDLSSLTRDPTCTLCSKKNGVLTGRKGRPTELNMRKKRLSHSLLFDINDEKILLWAVHVSDKKLTNNINKHCYISNMNIFSFNWLLSLLEIILLPYRIQSVIKLIIFSNYLNHLSVLCWCTDSRWSTVIATCWCSLTYTAIHSCLSPTHNLPVWEEAVTWFLRIRKCWKAT